MKILLSLVIASMFFISLPSVSPGADHPSGEQGGAIPWKTFGDALRYAQENNRLIFLYVYTDWCPQCRRMSDLTFNDPAVQYYLRGNFVCTRINAESARQHECNSQVLTERQIASTLGIDSYPSILILSPRGGSHGTFSGYRDATELQELLVYFGEGHFRTTPYNKWRNSR